MDSEEDFMSVELPSLEKYQDASHFNIQDSGYDTNIYGSSSVQFSQYENESSDMNIEGLSINDKDNENEKIVAIAEDEKKQECNKIELENLIKVAFTPDQDGDIYLTILLAQGMLSQVEQLIRVCGTNSRLMDIQNNRGQAPIHVAAFLNYADIIKMLIRYNARIDLVDEKGSNILHICAEEGHIETLKAIVEICDEKNEKEMLVDLLNETDFSGVTPFYLAVSKKRKDICQFLAQSELGVDVNKVDERNGNSPLHEAVMLENNAEIVFCLLKYCKVDANHKNVHSVTPLHIAACKGDEAICAILLEFGAQRDIADENGNIPAVYAATEPMLQYLTVS